MQQRLPKLTFCFFKTNRHLSSLYLEFIPVLVVNSHYKKKKTTEKGTKVQIHEKQDSKRTNVITT